MTTLRDLPPTAVYRQKQGRATIVVQRTTDTLLVTATCDSLERLLHYYAERSATLQRQVEEHKQNKQTQEEQYTRSPPWRNIGYGLLYGLSALLTLYIIYTIIKRKKY